MTNRLPALIGKSMPSERAEDGDQELHSELFNCLRKKPRRKVLFRLLDHNPQEALFVPEDFRDDGLEPDKYRLSMVHQHLPLLEESGFIRWDRDAGEIRKGPRFEPVRGLLKAIREER